jgi:type VI secretion system protein ImpJ
LRRTDATTFATAIDQERYFAAPVWYLAVGVGARSEDLARKGPQLLKVSSAEHLERLIRRALPGLGLMHVPVPPSSIPLKLNYQYFQLERTGEDWDAVRLSRHLAVYVPAELPDARLELVVLLS